MATSVFSLFQFLEIGWVFVDHKHELDSAISNQDNPHDNIARSGIYQANGCHTGSTRKGFKHFFSLSLIVFKQGKVSQNIKKSSSEICLKKLKFSECRKVFPSRNFDQDDDTGKNTGF